MFPRSLRRCSLFEVDGIFFLKCAKITHSYTFEELALRNASCYYAGSNLLLFNGSLSWIFFVQRRGHANIYFYNKIMSKRRCFCSNCDGTTRSLNTVKRHRSIYNATGKCRLNFVLFFTSSSYAYNIYNSIQSTMWSTSFMILKKDWILSFLVLLSLWMTQDNDKPEEKPS